MTTINLHGILAQEFGDFFELDIRKPKEVMAAINMNCSNFTKRIIDLSKEGMHYSIIIDGEDIKETSQLEINKSPKVIDIIPVICGSGVVIAAIGTIAMYAATTTALAGTVGGFLLGTIGAMALSIGVQMALAPDPAKAGKAPVIEVGGIKESFLFGSKANLVEQGSPVPVGYGRLRVGSNVILTTMHSHPIKNTAASKLRQAYSEPEVYEPEIKKKQSKKSTKKSSKAVVVRKTELKGRFAQLAIRKK